MHTRTPHAPPTESEPIPAMSQGRGAPRADDLSRPRSGASLAALLGLVRVLARQAAHAAPNAPGTGGEQVVPLPPSQIGD